MKRIYLKLNHKYWNMKKINRHSMKVWKIIILLMGLVVLYALIARYVNRMPLISPLVQGPIQVEAKEPEVVISCNDVVGYLRCKFYQGELTEQEAKTMIAIGKAESGLREKSKNKSSSAKGVFQILSGSTWYDYGCKGEIYEWKDNTDCAIKIMKLSGYTPWEAYNKGMHLKFMNVEI